MKSIPTAFILSLSLCIVAPAQESPDTSLAAMKTAPGFEVTLFAAEPMLRNPTTIDIDAQGRVWVAEAVNYRLFNQPAGDPEGDRIRVLEDTDGDGKADMASTFYQDPSLQAPMGIAVLGNRVYVCQAPDLFYLEDTDGDGKADKKKVILTGFLGGDHDHTVHGVVFGPDGYLYFSVGDRGLDVTDGSGNRVTGGANTPHPAASVLRTDLEGMRLEMLAWNLRNPYEPTVDAFGNVFISDNDDDGNEQVRICYILEGGDYGYWMEGRNGTRRGNRRLDEVHWNEDRPGVVPKMLKTGFGSPTGMAVYEGKLFPEKYYGALLHADAGPGVIRAYHTEIDGAGFKAEAEVLLSCPDDKWFRPSDVCVAPDGSIFVSDWYDPGVGGHRMKDYEVGRIYRLAPKGAKYKSPALDLSTSTGIAEALVSPNIARRYLGFAETEKRGGSATEIIDDRRGQRKPREQARLRWTLMLPGSNGLEVDRALGDPDPQVRTQMVRIAARAYPEILRRRNELHTDEVPAVRRQLLLELSQMPQAEWSDEWLLSLQAQYPPGDVWYRSALGIAMRGREEWAWDSLQARSDIAEWSQRTAELSWLYHPNGAVDVAWEAANDPAISPELRAWAVRTLDAIGSTKSIDLLIDTAKSNEESYLRDLAFELLARNEGQVWHVAMDNADFDDFLIAELDNPEKADRARDFIVGARRGRTADALAERAADPSRPEPDRIKNLDAIYHLTSSRLIPGPLRQTVVQTLADALDADTIALGDSHETYAMKTLVAIGHIPGETKNNLMARIVTQQDAPRLIRVQAMREATRNREGELVFLRLAEEDKIPTDMIFDTMQQLHWSKEDDIREAAERVRPPETMVGGHRLNGIYVQSLVTQGKGDPARGRAIFIDPARTQCSRCHTVNDEGGNIGPNLSKIGEKLASPSLLESIVNPNAAISHEYKVWNFDTGEDVITGFIAAEDDEAIEVMDSTGALHRIQPSEIQERWPSDVSLMPEGLVSSLTIDELADLIAYLETLK